MTMPDEGENNVDRPFPRKRLMGPIVRIVLGLFDFAFAALLVMYRPGDSLAVMAAVVLVLLGILYVLRGVIGLRESATTPTAERSQP